MNVSESVSHLSLLNIGGPVMWPILLLSCITLVIVIERTLFLHRGSIKTLEFWEGIKNLIQKRRLMEALTVCEETPGPVARVVKSALLSYNKGEDAVRLAIQSSASVEIPLLERRIGSLGAIAKVAPMLGLLGTVISMWSAFQELNVVGPYANSADFAGLFAQAIVSTIAGLILAVFGHLMHHFLYGRVRAVVQDIEWVGTSLLQLQQGGDDIIVVSSGENQTIGNTGEVVSSPLK